MTLKRDELIERLKKLAESEPPKNLSCGAMCYDPFAFLHKPETLGDTCLECWRTMRVGELAEILQEYRVPLKRIQDHGIDAILIIPKHCPRCGFGVQEKNFHLKIKYPDHPTPIQIELSGGARDLELMSLFLQGKDRYTTDNEGEEALKDKIDRLKALFGVADIE